MDLLTQMVPIGAQRLQDLVLLGKYLAGRADNLDGFVLFYWGRLLLSNFIIKFREKLFLLFNWRRRVCDLQANLFHLFWNVIKHVTGWQLLLLGRQAEDTIRIIVIQ